MPELAEVEFYRKQWNPGLGQRILDVHLHADRRIFKKTQTDLLKEKLSRTRLLQSFCSGKWMLFQFQPSAWLGIHLGMTGSLSVQPPDFKPGPHDHLVLAQSKHSLVFSDPRLFGQIRFHPSSSPPDWWQQLPPSLLDPKLSENDLAAFLRRRARSPLKAVLLMQERFPGIGNWMADEILWQARIRPDCPAGRITGKHLSTLTTTIKHVATGAMST
ncbi:MAG: Fpg/Nei family DNA glycosylase, partial [Blastochloris sp.]|nr:Fpg/Nei family DNA glycosylase [Blastochloris sp.]